MTPTEGRAAGPVDDLVSDELEEIGSLDEYELEDLLGCHVDIEYGD